VRGTRARLRDLARPRAVLACSPGNLPWRASRRRAAAAHTGSSAPRALPHCRAQVRSASAAGVRSREREWFRQITNRMKEQGVLPCPNCEQTAPSCRRVPKHSSTVKRRTCFFSWQGVRRVPNAHLGIAHQALRVGSGSECQHVGGVNPHRLIAVLYGALLATEAHFQRMLMRRALS